MYAKTAIICILICMLVEKTWGAKRVDAHLRARDTLRLRRQQRDEMPLDLPNLLQLTKGESLGNVRETNAVFGMKVERLQEMYQGIKVYDTAVTVHKTEDGQLTGEAIGTFVQDIAKDLPDTEVSISNKDALKIAIANEGDNIDGVSNVKYSIQIFLDENSEARLVNVLSYIVKGDKRPYYIIDVKSGDILKKWQGLSNYPCCERKYNASGGNENTGKITYGNMPYCLTPTITNGTCYLENEYVKVFDKDINSYETAYFACSEGYGDEVNGAYSPATDAFFHGTVVGKMFEEWFGSTPLGEHSVILKVHAGYHMENAYWDGTCCYFGDGYKKMYPFTSLDIVAHEIGHGVTEFNSDLEYWGESGGINEAFSDIMGEAAEHYLLKSDFITGGTVMKTDPYLREFERPENDGISISHVDDMGSTTDVHFSSGIYRRIWYVVVKEEGMPVRDAFSVFLHANKMYWHQSSSFYDASCGLLEAALDLGFEIAPFRKAFSDVGISFCSSISDIPVLQNNETQFGVLVSDKINPRFMMDTPKLAEAFIAYVKSNNSYDIVISVMAGGWNESDGAKMVVEDVNKVMIPDAGGKIFFIRLSLSHKPSEDECDEEDGVSAVAFTAGFSCKADRHDEDSFSGSGDDDDDYGSYSGSGDDDESGQYDEHDYDSYDHYDYYYINHNRRNTRSSIAMASC
ncbi:elastase-like [Mercenaria mercenaria]|uniref:elastase-like n=1 Tax=Mercenaria mercenaria TaxID=6596 RepID=UPI00234F6D14|nr:elastase-like [Mercenaria mercenaria]